MSLINPQARKKSGNGWLYAGNIVMVIIIPPVVFISSMIASAVLTVWFLDEGRITKWAKLIPEWMQFLKMEGLEQFTPEFNFVSYVSLILAIAVTAATIYMLYKTHTNSKEIGENNCESKILDALSPKENQTITYIYGKGTPKDPIIVSLQTEYPNGCVVISKSGKRVLTLGPSVPRQDGNYECEVDKYERIKDKEGKKEVKIEKVSNEKILEDFFKVKKEKLGEEFFKIDNTKDREEILRNDVTITIRSQYQSSELKDLIVSILHPQKQPKENTK